MVDSYVHDTEADPDDPAGTEAHPSGLHRPTAIPLRRAAPGEAAPADSAAHSDSSLQTGSRHAPATLHFTGLQVASHDGTDVPPPAGEPNALPRIIWLVAATGLLFCILAAWKYMADDPNVAIDAEQVQLSDLSSAGARPTAPQPGTADAGGTALAGAVGPAIEDESPSAGNEVTTAPPRATPPTPAADSSPASSGPESEEPAADDAPTIERPESGLPADDGPGIDRAAPESPTAGERPSASPEEGEPGMTVTITARTTARVRVICDGREAVDREMRGGEVESLRCEQLLRLSAPDASSIRLAINGSACQPLGEPGSRLFGYVIRADDYRTLCPEREEGSNVTR
jgi:hypothetical protein